MIDGDIISRILDKPSGGRRLEELIDDGIVRIIIEKRDPYYTIKNKIKECICEVTREVDEDYQSKMIQRLNKLYIKSSGHKAVLHILHKLY